MPISTHLPPKKTPCKCFHFPIPNSPKWESRNIPFLKQLTLLLSYVGEDASDVFSLQEDKDEFLIIWLLTFLLAPEELALAACSPQQAGQERELRTEPTRRFGLPSPRHARAVLVHK